MSVGAITDDRERRMQRELSDLEQKYGGRLGVAILDAAAATPIAQRGDERFLICSTFKFLAAAFVLARVDRAQESLSRRIVFQRDYLVSHSPITGTRVGNGGITIGEICEAAITMSDNSAGNLMLDSFGGPDALTAYARSLGDNVTILDHREPELNEYRRGDPRDTTSPLAMLNNLRAILLGNALSASSREQLTAWLLANRTGDNRLRAGVPHGWRVGDKTGTGGNNSTHDIAVIWPPERGPIVVTAYYEGANGSIAQREAVLSEVGRLATSRAS
jgi:beta-lactamase class A